MFTVKNLKFRLKLYKESYMSHGFKERKTKNALIHVINEAIVKGTKNNFDEKLIRFLFKARYLYLTKKDKKLENDHYYHSLKVA